MGNRKEIILRLKKENKKLKEEIKKNKVGYNNSIDYLKKKLKGEFDEKHNSIIRENNFLRENLTIENFALKFCHCLENYNLSATEELACQVYANTLPIFFKMLKIQTNHDKIKMNLPIKSNEK